MHKRTNNQIWENQRKSDAVNIHLIILFPLCLLELRRGDSKAYPLRNEFQLCYHEAKFDLEWYVSL